MIKKVNKVWGYEEWICNSDLYCGKILTLRKDCQCSKHYHKLKDETFYVLKGTIHLEIGKSTYILKEGDVIHIPRETIHRFIGIKDSKIIEFSTQHFDGDSYRLEESKNEIKRK